MAQDQKGAAQGGTGAVPGDDSAPIVAFDFDGTLTVRDSFTAFLAWRAGPVAYGLGAVGLVPAGVSYMLHRDRGRIKAAAVGAYLRGLPRAELEREAERFADANWASLMRPDALSTWERWGAEGLRRVIVTASPDIVVAPFARRLGADDLLGTQIAFDSADRVVGAFSTPNCRGPEKVVRLKERFGEGVILRAAYGDTSGDTEMLEMAQESGFQVFTGRP